MAKQLDMWTSSREGSPAKTLAPRTPAPKGLMVQGADSSSSCSESSARLDQLGLSLRTHLRCALEAQTGYSMTWKDKGTPAGRSWWVLGMSLHPIDGTEPGLLPTPSGGRRLSKDVEWRGTTAYHLSKKRQVALETVVLGHLPTPSAAEYGSSNNGCPRDGRREEFATKGKPSLRYMLTPTSTGNLNSPSMDKWAGARALREMMKNLGVGGTAALARIYQWMMGYPRGWLDGGSKPTETP